MDVSAHPSRERVLEAIGTSGKWARTYGRPDLLARLESAEARLHDPAIRVLVVGEYKKGKSSLVNALLNGVVCPVDPHVATVVPTEVRYAERPQAFAYLAGDGDLRREAVELDALVEIATERARDDRIVQIELGLPRDLLAAGFRLVDTPGVGGLASVHGTATMASLPSAEVVVFVTDASQELTAPELEFLRAATDASPSVCCVLTKIDLYPEWRKVMNLDERHLREAGIDATLTPVSSVLRQLALERGDRDLNAESGYPALIRSLQEILADAERVQVASAVHDQLSVIAQVGSALRAERDALADPNAAEALVRGLDEASAAAARLRDGGARWQATLADGISDLASDMDHRLRLGFRAVTGEADAVIDDADPGQVWEELRGWVHRRTATALAEAYGALGERSSSLAQRVAALFDEDSSELEVAAHAPIHLLDEQALGGLSAARTARFQQALNALQRSYSGPMMVSFIGGLAGLAAPMLTPIGLGLGIVLGGRALRDERTRQLASRRQEAKGLARRYLEEVSLRVSKDVQDAVRRVHRHLRDTLLVRAEELQRSAADAVAAARRAVEADHAQRQDRLALLGGELQKLEGFRGHLVSLIPGDAR